MNREEVFATVVVACNGLASAGVFGSSPVQTGSAQQAGGSASRETDQGNLRIEPGQGLAESPTTLTGALSVGIRELIQGLLKGSTAGTIDLRGGRGQILVLPEDWEREKVPGALRRYLDALGGKLEAFRVCVFLPGHLAPLESKAARMSVSGVPDLQSRSEMVRVVRRVSL